MSSAIDVRGAFRIYSSASGAVAALQGLDLLVKRGELVVALGPSGSGKTTLLRVIGGFERLSAGSAHVLGTDVGRASSTTNGSFRAAKLGFLDQHYSHSLSPHLTCRRNVALQLELLGTERRDARARADALLERVGLLDRRADLPETLSGGEQQRVAVCAAIAHRPQLLLADEPVGELDAESAATIYELLADLVCETGTTALVVSHDPASAAIPDRVVTISDGRTVDERLPGEPTALVVSRGWIRVPESDLRALGRPSRLAVEQHPRGLALRGVHDSPDGGGPAAVSRTEAVPSGAPHDDPDPPLVAELRGVGKRYAAGTSARVVLDDTSASFRGGRLVAVVGRSGTGKTTLLRLLAGLERPSAGDVLLLGNSLAARTRSQLATLRREHVALVAQEPGLVPYLGASENLRLNLRLRGLPPSDEAIEEALGAVGLDSRLGNRADTLSAGERQRVAIARALASRRDLVLADEPTARLDREHGNIAGALLRGAADEHGCAVVCATHDPELIELADEVIALPGITDSRPQRAPSGA